MWEDIVMAGVESNLFHIQFPWSRSLFYEPLYRTRRSWRDIYVGEMHKRQKLLVVLAGFRIRAVYYYTNETL